ncbi:MAG: hypothetical protein V3T88_02670 [Nitrosomonadaceae bacterium]
MATGLAIVAAIGAVAGAVQQRKISKAQRRQNKLTNKVAAITRQRNVKRSIAASRIQVGIQQSLGFQLGVGGGTAVQGGTAGILSDTASTIGQSNLQFASQGFLSGFQDDISRAQQSQAAFGAVTSIAGGLASNPQATAALTNLVS